MIIDSHVHIGGDTVELNMTEDTVLLAMEKYNIDICLVSNGDACEYGHDLELLPSEIQVDQKTALERVIRFAKENEGRFYAGFWCKPHHENLTAEIEQLVAENRQNLVFLKAHPYHSNLAFDDDKMIPYLELAVKYNLPVVIHTGEGYNDSPARVLNMARKYPQLKFIMAHMGLGTDNKEAVELIGKLPNLYGDTTWVSLESTLEIVKRYGSKKIFFGSDSPIDGLHTYGYNMKGETSLYQRYFNELEALIGTSAYEDIMYKNAMRVFGIKR